jgi:20S proteasome alpha/beta subunit
MASFVDHHRAEKFRFKVNMYKLKEERDIEPRTLAHLVSSTLYERRYETHHDDDQWIRNYAST